MGSKWQKVLAVEKEVTAAQHAYFAAKFVNAPNTEALRAELNAAMLRLAAASAALLVKDGPKPVCDGERFGDPCTVCDGKSR